MERISGLLLSCLVGVSLLFTSGCGSSDPSEWLNAFANGMSVASPTAASSSSASSTISSVASLRGATSVDGSRPLADKVSSIESLAKGEASGGCAISLPTFNGFSARAECFGPNVNYSNHQDGADQSPAQFPSGDLGIWEAAESDGNACAAAQFNKLIEVTSAYVDTALVMQAAAICTLNDAGTEIPSLGADAVDFSSAFGELLQDENPSATVTAASVSTISDGVQQFTFTGTTDGAREFSVIFRIKKTSETEYQGRMYGYFDAQNRDAFTLTFKRESNDLKVRMVAGSWESSKSGSDIFDSNGDMILDDTWFGNMNQAILNVSAADGTGNASFGWQAGSGDDKTRVFNVYATGTSGSISGCGFAGYGDDFDADYTNNTNAIDGFICNWAGPNNDHSMSTTSGLAQKQCFTQSGTVMSEVTAKRAITYAPTRSCNDTTSMTYDWPAHSGDGATNDLITLASDSDYSSYTAPTAPSLDSGI